MKSHSSVLALVLGLSPLALPAQTPPLGSEFLVNTYTNYDQTQPALASTGAGDFVVVWRSQVGDGSGYGIFGQRFDHLGAKAGSQFQVNTYTTGDQDYPAVAGAGNGSFVVVWESKYQDGSSEGIFGQRFGLKPSISPFLPPTLVKVGSEFQVNTYTTGSQSGPAIAMNGEGGFVIVWNSFDSRGDNVIGQIFDASGARVGSEFQVNTSTLGAHSEPSVGFDGAGNFVVAWTGPDVQSYGVFAQRFDRTGTKVGPEFLVNKDISQDQNRPSLAVGKAGDFVVVWDSWDQDLSSWGVFGRRFDSSGEPLGDDTQINTYTPGPEDRPSVAADGAGNFVVVWDSPYPGVPVAAIFEQRFDRAGNRIGGNLQLSTYNDFQLIAKVVNDGAGFDAVWVSAGQDGSGSGIYGRREDRAPVGLSVDSRAANGTISDANGVLEPGEEVLVAPAWSNRSTGNFGDFAGTVANFIGPAAVYSITGPSADYGPIPSGGLGVCDDGTATAPCYKLGVSGPRPVTHWDATLEEDVSFGGGHVWTIHVGDSFTDVPRSQPFYKKIETLLHYGITNGCTPTTYCPGNSVTRDQMSIFIGKGIAGLGELVPTTGFLDGQAYNCSPGGHSLFTDVSPTDAFCRHVHYLAAENVTTGCGNNQYCPTSVVTRDTMASFIAKAIVAPGGGNAVPLTYGPDPGTGFSYSCDPTSPNIHFSDVPTSNAFCKHIHYLWARGIVTGCTPTTYCPTQTVARDAMAKFIANGFGLQLYRP
jgi:S-layer family protein